MSLHNPDNKLEDDDPLKKYTSAFTFAMGLYGLLGDDLAGHKQFLTSIRKHITDNTFRQYEDLFDTVKAKDAANAGIMINLLKLLDANRFENEVKKHITIKTGFDNPNQAFEKSFKTIGDYKNESRFFTTIAEHYKYLIQCVAISQTGYIIKNRVANSYRYKEVTINELRNQLDGKAIMKLKKKVWNAKKQELDEIDDTVSFNACKEIQETLRPELAYYHKTDLFSDEEGVLSRYVPPSGDANPELAEKFIKFFESRVYNPEALHDMLSAHAYRLRHPSVKIEKVFILYSPPPGNSGKTFLSSAIDMLYPDLSVLGAREADAKSEFNGLFYEFLNVNFEELQNENYRNQFFEIIIKQTTNRKGAHRKMFHDVTQGEIKAIVSLCTNSKDLYGLIRADGSTLSRLCILSFKPGLRDEEWSTFKREVGLDSSMPDYNKTQRAFAAAFWNHLRYTYKNPYLKDLECYSPVRYRGSDKDRILAELRRNSERPPTKLIKALMLPAERVKECRDYQFSVLKRLKDRKIGPLVFISNSEIERIWADEFNIPKEDKGKYTSQSVKDELQRLGWRDKHTKTARGYALELQKYQEWRSSILRYGKNDDENDDDLLEEDDNAKDDNAKDDNAKDDSEDDSEDDI